MDGAGVTAAGLRRRPSHRVAESVLAPVRHRLRGGHRAVNVSKDRLEGLFVDELRELQPSPGYMRLVKERVLHAWRELREDARTRADEIERRLKTIRQKLDRLDEAFLYERSIDIETYDRQKDRLREEQTLAQIDRHSTRLEEIDVEGTRHA
jgi:hypothetical protein